MPKTAAPPPNPVSQNGRVKPKSAARDLVTVYVGVSGPKRGQPDAQAAFASRKEAVEYLTRQHGLATQEAGDLNKKGSLDLKRQWHGSERCAVKAVAVNADLAARLLQGEGFSELT